uniref:26S proteasome complex subunit dss-1 n=1 Tax=Romanomermis culicivorax TaxID=13658 RepID=A0A915L8D0_ROMCU
MASTTINQEKNKTDVGDTLETEKKVDVASLEEDDEFEEFPVENWASKEKDDEEDVNVWEDNWDDDTVEDDFSVQLRAELKSMVSS